jgi:hypothetical protein
MALRFKCPNCGRARTLSHNEIGEAVLCFACGTRFLFEQAVNIEVTYKTIELPPAPPESRTAGAPPPLPRIEAPLPLLSEPLESPYPEGTSRWLGIGCLPVVLIAVVLLFTGIELFVRLLPHQLAQVELMIHQPPWAPKLPNDRPVYHDSVPAPVLPKVPVPVIAHSAKPWPSIVIPSAPVPFSGMQFPRHRIRPPWPATAPANAGTSPTAAIPATPPVAIGRAPVPAAPAFHPLHDRAEAPDLDDQIGQSIDRGVDYLLGQFSRGELRLYSGTSGESAGEDALAVYALLQAGEATHDLRLGPNSPLVDKMLNALKAMDMNRDHTVYARSLRSAALSVYHRSQDKLALRVDANWLMHADLMGAYTYEAIQPSGSPMSLRERILGTTWDNSNSQYGALGVWAAAEAGVEVPASFWNRVRKHWLQCQLRDGEWSYAGYADSGRHSMTVAGITTLFVTEDQLDARAVIATLGHEPFTPALRRGLDWLEQGDNSVDLAYGWRTYDLFGLERAALASGFKYFGSHDWYRELAVQQLHLQLRDGSWAGYDPTVDTAYTLLFLSRGRHPIFMNKLRFDGFWANRPRDIANLTHYASTELERPLNWQVVSFRSDWSDWMDSPVLYIASHEAPKFTDDDLRKLREFADAGGLIFTHADGDSPQFNQFVASLSRSLFPQYPLRVLPPDHPIYSTLYKIKPIVPLEGVSNGSRLLLVHSPTDLNKAWQQQDWVQRPNQFQMGINIFIYAAGKADLRNKLKTAYVREPTLRPILQTSIAEIRYPGNWNPEPSALPRFSRIFLSKTGVNASVAAVDPAQLDPATMPLAHLAGTGAMHFTPGELTKIRDYVTAGGILLIDPCGGSPAFLKSTFVDFLPHAFPAQTPQDMQPSNPILAGTGEGMSPVNLRLRPYRSELDGMTTIPIEYFTEGKGAVLLSQVDLTTALLGTDTWPINGYTPAASCDLLRNVMLLALEKPREVSSQQ